MSPTRKIFAIVLILSTLVSVVTISYVMNLFFGAFKVMNLLSVSVASVDVESSDSAYVSIETVLLVENPTEYPIKLMYLKEELYLNTMSNLVGQIEKTMYSNPLDLPQFSKVNTTVRLNNVPVDKIAGQSSKIWFVRIDKLIIRGVPFLGRVILQNLPITSCGNQS